MRSTLLCKERDVLATPKQGEVVCCILLKNGTLMKRIHPINTDTTFTPRSVRAKHFSPLNTPPSVQNRFNLCCPCSLERWNTDETDSTGSHRFHSSKQSVQNPFNPRSRENGTRMQEMRGVRTDYGLLRLSGITLIGFIYFYCSNTYFLCGDFMKRYKKNRLFRLWGAKF